MQEHLQNLLANNKMDITIKSIPDGITEKEVCEWVEILIKRKERQGLDIGSDLDNVKSITQEQIDTAKKVVTDYKKDNNITAVAVEEPIEEEPIVEEPK